MSAFASDPIRLRADDFLALCLSIEEFGGIGGGSYCDRDGDPLCLVGHTSSIRRRILYTNIDFEPEDLLVANRIADGGLTLSRNDSVTPINLANPKMAKRIDSETYFTRLNDTYGLEIVENG